MSETLNITVGIILLGLAFSVLLLLGWRYRRGITLNSLGNRLLVAFVGVAVISVALVIAAIAWQLRTTLTEKRGQDLIDLAQLNSQRLAEQLVVQVGVLQNLSETLFVVSEASAANRLLASMPPDEREAKIQAEEEEWVNDPTSQLHRALFGSSTGYQLGTFIQDFPIFNQIILTDASGRLIAIAGEEPPNYYQGDQTWWREAWNEGEGQVYMGQSRLWLWPDDKIATVDVAVPIFPLVAQETGGEAPFKPIGILRARLRLNDLSVLSETPAMVTYDVALLDNATRTLLHHSNPTIVEKLISTDIQEYIRESPVDWGIDPDQTGQNVIHSHVTLPQTPDYLNSLEWVIIVQEPESVTLGGLRDFLQPVLIGGLVVLGLAILVGSGISWQLARPIRSLTGVAMAMAGGQFDQSASVTGPAELRILAQSFNSMTDQLRQTLAGLEQRVAERTQRLEIVATLGEHLSAILNLEELLAEVVDRIQESFGYYHAHIYLFDDKRKNLVVVAGTGEAGTEMKERGHGIPLDGTSLVARAARTGQVVRVDNVRESEDWLPNPLLPETHSEMAVPIILGGEGQVVGVLDVQEEKIAGLDEGDSALLRSLANQVAVAIHNARLFESVETALAEARAAQEQYLEQAWEKTRVTPGGQYLYTGPNATPLDETKRQALTETRQQALAQNRPVVVAPNDGGSAGKSLVTPINLYNKRIGTLQLHTARDDEQTWSEDDLDLVEAVIDQLVQTAENLRLFEETRERAGRERTIREITDKLRAASNLDTLLETAARELGQRLNVRHTVLELGIETASNGDDMSTSTREEA